MLWRLIVESWFLWLLAVGGGVAIGFSVRPPFAPEGQCVCAPIKPQVLDASCTPFIRYQPSGDDMVLVSLNVVCDADEEK